MKQLLAIEWMKIKPYRTFWILLVLFAVAVLGINYISFYINSNVNDVTNAVGLGTGNPFSFPNIWLTVPWMCTWVLYFPGFIIIFLTTNEYTFKTHRQNIIDGQSRYEFVATKLAVAFLLALTSTLFVFFTTLTFGLAGGSALNFSKIYYLGYFFVLAWVYILFALMLAFLLRKAALSVGLFFIYGLIIDNVLSGLLRKLFEGKPYGNLLLPLEVADSLLPFPFFKDQLQMVLRSPNALACLGISLAWVGFYHFFMLRKFRNEDL
jgi:ABC-2 type transport system permease protein